MAKETEFETRVNNIIKRLEKFVEGNPKLIFEKINKWEESQKLYDIDLKTVSLKEFTSLQRKISRAY